MAKASPTNPSAAAAAAMAAAKAAIAASPFSPLNNKSPLVGGKHRALPGGLASSPLAVVGASGVVPSFHSDKKKKPYRSHGLTGGNERSSSKNLLPLGDPAWQPTNEYDPLWPNDYTKVAAEIRDSKRANAASDDEHTPSGGKRRYADGTRDKARERLRDSGGGGGSGFSRRPRGGEDDYSDEENDREDRGGNNGDRDRGDRDRDRSSDRRRGGGGGSRRSAGSSGGGAAIAPPPSLTESSSPATTSDSKDGLPGSAKGGLGIAAKIMAKYGYKQGQGLGRSEQGMSKALAVEKTSKRGGRIVHEKELMPPPMFGESFKNDGNNQQQTTTPPSLSQIQDEYDDDEYGAMPVGGPPGAAGLANVALAASSSSSAMPPPGPQAMPCGMAADDAAAAKPSITDLMRNPSQVVLCKNMVGPGEVDDDLEPEVKEECNGKYGDVSKVVIFEMPNVPPEEAVRIFIEFKRVESAIKAVVDLNGRFFGGREVQARFYDQDKFSNLSLYD